MSLQQETSTSQPAFIPRKSTLSQSVSSLQKQATTRSLPTPFPTSTTSNIVPNVNAIDNSTPLPLPASVAKSTYNSSYLAQLKASTPTRQTLAREPGAVIAYDVDEDSSMPLEEGMEDTTAGIPDEAAIKSAIARRRRHALQQTSTSDAAALTEGGEDYISLTANTSRLAVYDHSAAQGPHPESRLQRESDSEGEGDEQFAAFTGADERLGLRAGNGGNLEHARRMRKEMRDALEDVDMDADVGDVGLGGQGDSDEERWEDEQIRRAGAGLSSHHERKSRQTVRLGFLIHDVSLILCETA